MYSCPSSMSTIFAVRILRRNKLVCTSSNLICDSFIMRPAWRASKTPVSVSGVSVHPIKILSRFQVDCPCRKKHKLYGVSALSEVRQRREAHFSASVGRRKERNIFSQNSSQFSANGIHRISRSVCWWSPSLASYQSLSVVKLYGEEWSESF